MSRTGISISSIDPPQAGVGGDLRIQPLLQAQAEVGVFGGVGGRLVDRHLVETDLLRSLAAERFVGDRREAEVAARELAEVVPADAVLAGFEDVGLEQGVVRARRRGACRGWRGHAGRT
jgi:hypothetical protein